jgi:hypothetical protein
LIAENSEPASGDRVLLGEEFEIGLDLGLVVLDSFTVEKD